MMHDNHIRAESVSELTAIIANLVREQVTFKAYKDGGYWMIELTGGF